MKKVLPVLVLSALFVALLVPTTASLVSAASCGTGCRTITSANTCECGATPLPDGTGIIKVCDNGVVRNSCTGTGTGAIGEAPTVVSSAQDLINLVERIGNWVFVALMSVAGMFLIIAGFMHVTAGGNPEKAGKGRQMLINALIGVVIGLLARGIVQVIKSIIST